MTNQPEIAKEFTVEEMENLAKELLARKSNMPWEQINDYAKGTWLDMAEFILTRTAELQQECDRVSSEWISAGIERDQLKEQNAELQRKNAELREENRGLKRNQEFHQSDTSVLKGYLKDASIDLDQLRTQNELLQSQLNELGEVLAKWFPDLNKPEQFPVERAIHQLRQLVKQVEELKKERDDAVAAFNKLAANLEELQVEALQSLKLRTQLELEQSKVERLKERLRQSIEDCCPQVIHHERGCVICEETANILSSLSTQTTNLVEENGSALKQLTNLSNASAIVLGVIKDTYLGEAFQTHKALLKMEIEETQKILKS